VQIWKDEGWVLYSPDGVHVRLTPKGREQLEAWDDEERVWKAGETDTVPLPKRLVAGEPARNLRKLSALLRDSTVVGIHDPYTRAASLTTLLKLSELGVGLASSLRILGSQIQKSTERTALVDFLKDINTEKGASWEIRIYTTIPKPHRRFFVLNDGSVVTCGMSLNHIDKDEVLDRLDGSSDYAKHDCQFFEDHWTMGTTI
jgi:hypothetical protein